MSSVKRVCAHPGCDVPLHALNKRGVCDLHHHIYACQCTACAARARTKSAGVGETATMRVVHVPIVGNAQSEIHRAPVSVAREPWHK